MIKFRSGDFVKSLDIATFKNRSLLSLSIIHFIIEPHFAIGVKFTNETPISIWLHIYGIQLSIDLFSMVYKYV